MFGNGALSSLLSSRGSCSRGGGSCSSRGSAIIDMGKQSRMVLDCICRCADIDTRNLSSAIQVEDTRIKTDICQPPPPNHNVPESFGISDIHVEPAPTTDCTRKLNYKLHYRGRICTLHFLDPSFSHSFSPLPLFFSPAQAWMPPVLELTAASPLDAVFHILFVSLVEATASSSACAAISFSPHLVNQDSRASS